jgi:hypothetical protein
VALLQTNGLQLRAELGVLQTNVAAAQREARAAGREVEVLADAERAARRRVAQAKEKLADQQRRLTVRTQELAGLQAGLVALGTNASRGPGRAEQLQRQLAAAQEAAAAGQTNLAGLEAQLRAAETDQAGRLAAVDAQRTLWGTRQAEQKALETRLNERTKDSQVLRRELAGQEQALNSQGDQFTREMRRSLKDAGSYEAIYRSIGQLLWTGDRLVRSEEPRVRRQGAQYFEAAAQSAVQDAEDAALAARICEGWVWAYLDYFNLPGQGTAGADQALGSCNGIFQRAGALAQVERNYHLMLTNAPSARRTDAIRYNLGGFLEEKGSLREALALYRQIQDTNYVRHAERRIGQVEERLAGAR